MPSLPALFAAPSSIVPWMIVVGFLLVTLFILMVIVVLVYGNLWFQAYMSRAGVSILDLIGMTFRQVPRRLIVQGKIMAVQSGIGSDKQMGITTRRLEAHYLAGGNVMNVIKALIAAHRADLDFLLGELVSELEAGHTYVSPGEMPKVERVPGGFLGCGKE